MYIDLKYKVCVYINFMYKVICIINFKIQLVTHSFRAEMKTPVLLKAMGMGSRTVWYGLQGKASGWLCCVIPRDMQSSMDGQPSTALLFSVIHPQWGCLSPWKIRVRPTGGRLKLVRAD